MKDNGLRSSSKSAIRNSQSAIRNPTSEIRNPKFTIVLTTFGSFGDIHPYMAIAMELKRRGHDPVIATMPLYREKIEGTGLRFAPVRPDLPPPQEQNQELIEKIMEPRSGPKFLIEEVILPHLRDSYADLVEAVRGADLLVTHPATYAGPLVGRQTEIPWISTVLAPLSFFSAYDLPVPPFWPWTNKLRILGPRFVRPILDFLKDRYRPKIVDTLREELGIADFGNPVFEGQHSPALVLALFSKHFAAPQPDWPPQTGVTGFAFYDGRHEKEMPIKLERFLTDGPAPLIFTLGSSAVWVAQNFFQESIAAARKLGKRAVLLIGDQRNRPPEPLPSEIIAVDYAPFESLLERGCVMVHHGGIGTTAQGLRAGIPTLIVPFAFDQSDNAAHAERLGSSRTLYRQQYRANWVAAELVKLLGQSRYSESARRVAELLRRENGAARACDEIEEFLKRVKSKKEADSEPAYAASY